MNRPLRSLWLFCLVSFFTFAAPAAAAGTDSGAAKTATKTGAAEVSKVSDAKKAAPKAETAPAPKIPGLVLNRPGGGFLGLTIENGSFKLSFYDAKKKPVHVDVERAAARWPVQYKPGDERTVLLPTSDGNALLGSRFVRPPYAFKLYLSLFAAGNDSAVESYVIDYHQ